MENEIKVNEYVRTKDGVIAKVTYVDELMVDTDNDVFDLDNLSMMEIPIEYVDEYIVKHSPNLIDLIQCGDYVNGKEVIMDLQKSKEWYKSEDDFITCKDYTFEEDEIKTIVTKEMMESISYKVTKM